MSEPQTLLQSIRDLPPRERAAAIAHHVYVLTARRVGWELRVPAAWNDLPDDAKEFNAASVDTWAQEPEIRDAWCELVRSLGADDAGAEAPGTPSRAAPSGPA